MGYTMFVMTGKWLRVKSLEEMKERAIFETACGGYIMAEDTGYFSVGDNREEGKGSWVLLQFSRCHYFFFKIHFLR